MASLIQASTSFSQARAFTIFQHLYTMLSSFSPLLIYDTLNNLFLEPIPNNLPNSATLLLLFYAQAIILLSNFSQLSDFCWFFSQFQSLLLVLNSSKRRLTISYASCSSWGLLLLIQIIMMCSRPCLLQQVERYKQINKYSFSLFGQLFCLQSLWFFRLMYLLAETVLRLFRRWPSINYPGPKTFCMILDSLTLQLLRLLPNRSYWLHKRLGYFCGMLAQLCATIDPLKPFFSFLRRIQSQPYQLLHHHSFTFITTLENRLVPLLSNGINKLKSKTFALPVSISKPVVNAQGALSLLGKLLSHQSSDE